MNRSGWSIGTFFLGAISVPLLCLFFSCDLFGRNDSDGADGSPIVVASVTAENIQGIWLAGFDSPIEYAEGETADIWLFQFGGSDYEMVFYEDGIQVGGNRGTFVVADAALDFASGGVWDAANYWSAEAGTFKAPCVLQGGDLFIEGRSGTVAMKKVVFSRPSYLVRTWNDSVNVESMTLNANGTYTFTDDAPYTENGDGWGITGTASGLFRFSARMMNGDPVEISYLFPYTFSGGALTLTYADGDHVYR